MSSKTKLEYLPEPELIKEMMQEVREVWVALGVSMTKPKDSKVELPMLGGKITLQQKETGYQFSVEHFPYKKVILFQDKDSESWKVVKGNKKAYENAVKMTDILFMNEYSLELYAYRAISRYEL